MHTKKRIVLLGGLLCTAVVLAGQQQRAAPAVAADQQAAPQALTAKDSSGLQRTNTGEQLPVVFEGHVLTVGRRFGLIDEQTREIRQRAMSAQAAAREGPVSTNTGEVLAVKFTGHDLTVDPAAPAGGILYAPTEPDDPTFRAAVAACTGAPCDYYDARAGTPSLPLLCTYDCVFTWVNYSYADKVAMGDALADYVDIGCGKVVLGQWCYESDQTNWLDGRIMTSDYCPVTVEGSYGGGTYSGDGADCVHVGPPFVGAYSTDYRDRCTLLSKSGVQSDGTFTDGWLSVAWRQDRKVYYSAGNLGLGYGSTGEWDELLCNMCLCARPGGVLYAPTQPDNPTFRLGVSQCLGVPCDYFDARAATPSLSLLSNYDCVLTWVNYAYDDAVAMGDRLADYVDAGYGRVILGQWCYESDQVNWLEGRIMTPDYCPVTVDSSYNQGTYNGDGVDCVHTRDGLVSAYDTAYLDNCTLVAGALTDGTFDDFGVTRLSVSWRPDRRVYYSAGNTGSDHTLTPGGDWAELVCNICKCFFGCGLPDAGPCCEAHGTPGCDDHECCESVCAYDPYCCEVEWDWICADEAASDYACLDCVCADEATPPVAELDTPPELGGGCACDVVGIEGSAYDPDGTFESYTLDYRRVGTPAWTVIATSGTPVVGGWLADWDTTALTEGYYNLRLTVTNVCGMAATAVRTVYVDQAYNTVTVDYPPDGHIVAGNVCFDGTVFENWCGSTYRVDYRPAGGGAWQPVDPLQPTYPGTHVNEPFAYWDTVGLGVADGDYDVKVEAWNDCGHTKVEILQVTVDNTSPTAIIASPANCDAVDGLVDVIGTANDVNLSAWHLWYTGGAAHNWVLIDSGTTPVIAGLLAVWDTSGLMPCAYTLRLRVLDEAELGCNTGHVHETNYYVSVGVGGYGVDRADINCDGHVDGFDIDGFVQCVIAGECPECP